MKLSQVLAGLEPLSVHADGDLELGGVSYDSRTTRPGDLFVAVTGYAVDGHRFIHKAVENGAVAVLCERPPEEDIPYVTVSSTRAALAQVGANWFDHPAEKLTVVGVTGTNGKTTVTYLLKSVLEQCYGAKVGLIGTIQNMIGDEVIETERTTPESFELQGLFARMVEAGCSHAIMEVSSHALVLHRVDCIPFAVGVFTNLTEDHLDFHKTMEEYGKAKAQLFRRCKAGVLNHDDPAWETMADGATCTIRTYTARGADAQVSATDLDLASDHVSFTVRSGGQCQAVTLGIPGGFTVYNALVVIGASLELGLSLPEIAAALTNAKGVKGRVEVVPTPGKDYTILIARDGLSPSLAAAATGTPSNVPLWAASAWSCRIWRSSPPIIPGPRTPWPSSTRLWRALRERKSPMWSLKTGGRPSAGPWTTRRKTILLFSAARAMRPIRFWAQRKPIWTNGKR